MKFLWIVTLLFVPIILAYQSTNNYNIIIEKITNFPDNDTLWGWKEFRPTKYNRTTSVLTGVIQLIQPLTDDIELSVSVYVYQGNEYRKLMDNKFDQICTKIIGERFFDSLADETTIPLRGPCPISDDSYQVTNMAIYNKRLPFEPPTAKQVKIDFDFINEKKELLSHSEWHLIIEKLGIALN